MAKRAPISTTGVSFATSVSVHIPVLFTCQTANLSGERRSPFVLRRMSPSTPTYASAAACILPPRSVALMPSVLPDPTADSIALPRMNSPSYAE